MKGYRKACFGVLIIIIIGMIACVFGFGFIGTPSVDLVLLNEIAHEADSSWDNLQSLGEEDFGCDFLIAGSDGRVLYSSADVGIESYNEAVLEDYSHFAIRHDGRITGEVFLIGSKYDDLRKAVNMAILVMALMFICLFAVLFLFGKYVKRSIVTPFEELKDYAGEIAMGNLDVKLNRSEENMFGDFTESFDIMREELKDSRKREAELRRREKELVAELSHDLKTPITGIKLTSELLEAKLSDEYAREKIRTIYQKADQIDAMVNDLFAATLDDLGEIKVNISDTEAGRIPDMVKKADDLNLCTQMEIPECLLSIDPRRMEQVISNLLNNSYKYANTKIEVHYKITGGYLEMTFRDFGPGVNEDEIHLITNKYFRGSSEDVAASEGSGLGLYISRMLIERMNGELLCRIADPGLEVRILIPLA